MCEKEVVVHDFTKTDESLFETLVDRNEVMINHVIVPEGNGFPAHPTDATVCIQVLRGILSISLGEEKPGLHGPGKIIEIERQTMVQLGNGGDGILELLVVKAPHPRTLS